MHFRLFISVFFLFRFTAQAQTPFTAAWDFEGNTNGSVNSPNVSVSSVGLSGSVNQAGFPAGASGTSISIRLWTTGGLNTNKYVEFSITPQNYRCAITSVSFACNRSPQGPTQVALRSSQDGFSGNLGSGSVGENFGTQNYSVSFSGLENTVTFRIYAYSAMDDLGTLRIDNLRINGTVMVIPLPVELTYFRGQAVDRQVELSWETAWEKNAAHFDVQRSRELKEFITFQSLAAAGDVSDERTHYTAMDASPVPGVMYYRLRQVDRDGQFMYSKIIAVYYNSEEPQLWVFGNPASRHGIQVRLRHIAPSEVRLFSFSGQSLPLQWQPSGTDDYIFQTIAPAGWYWLVGEHQGKRVSQKMWLTD
ncbi:hypothetical protein [Runella slithyformis]|uniref:T9SS type A sorting domain-containing protein n=1 Tax=Runella slithyformis (strain ATCC 29530 / DSM 19594 / LMG 11500 / NCIMB 11436 / LSU 4) TaxID=761193 RepID=A0A7U3ZHS3_RUNSL|nr:hypothetical protein [Runella slithyformis]AEI47476.1 hypothetical protein Runsl_1045 [Runella slithyformis DSM 19594]